MKISLSRCSSLTRTPRRLLLPFSSSFYSPSLRRSSSSTSTPPPYQAPTIYALATPPGKAGVAVLRISGPAVPEVYKQMIFRRAQQTRGVEGVLPSPRKMVLREIRVPQAAKEDAGEVIDEGLVVYFPGKHNPSAQHSAQLAQAHLFPSSSLSSLFCFPSFSPSSSQLPTPSQPSPSSNYTPTPPSQS